MTETQEPRSRKKLRGFIVVAHDRREGRPPICRYLTKSGCLAYDAKKAYPFKSLVEAARDREYFAKESPYEWGIEKLYIGPRAHLSAEPVDLTNPEQEEKHAS
jgi:hypothetical protein